VQRWSPYGGIKRRWNHRRIDYLVSKTNLCLMYWATCLMQQARVEQREERRLVRKLVQLEERMAKESAEVETRSQVGRRRGSPKWSEERRVELEHSISVVSQSASGIHYQYEDIVNILQKRGVNV
jgi:hypothetical protein